MDKIEEVLTRGVEKIYPSKEGLEKVLRSGKKLRIYNGIDPTGKLHLGHMVVLRKLRQLQDLDQEIIVLMGDFTAQIGDPTDKLATRKQLTKAEVERNSANYKELIGKILDLKRANVRFLHNEEWTNKLKPVDMLQIASQFTVSQLLERDMFQKRIEEGKEIYVHEFLYPIFQAYDSVTMNVDMEIGGNDQTFNMLAGRTLMKKMINKEKFVLTTQLLTEPGKEKMGKTEGNLIALDEKPSEMFGKIMSWPDEMIQPGFILLTDIPMEKVETEQLNPIEKKKWLAREIVTNLHSEKDAKNAEKEFEQVFQKGQLPEENITVYSIKPTKKQDIIEILTTSGLVKSNSEAKRLINQGGVDIDGFTLKEFSTDKVKDGTVIRAGKKKFVKIKIK
ncbi:tyrosine--tRNA ligase [Candidatus Woesebacteria bacterium CG_4_10_14_0_2_um_filter_39_14]|uniref:Tyrosine--tRNA ligase n=3 Tax=Microgenomates group TaxID=1794810 RepID=A0A2M7TM30_9BACT|nr:MAG: tyrosine--tRNA ligase [Candidatus Woesebacteria bacterium CG_4_10_14_0_2_um_filter_39_14]